jgi:putative ABC transport system ATP-binding protein
MRPETAVDGTPRTAPVPVLEVQGLGLTIPSRRGTEPLTIFSDVSLTVAEGTALCLAGRSGIGKTTVLRACAGFVQATEGALAWRGTPMTGWADKDWETWRAGHLGFLDQDSEMLPDLRIIENVMIPLASLDSGGRDRVRELLTALAVDKIANSWPQSCSGGERQRCGVARALIGNPDLLILDEPTASLDTRNANRVLDVLTAAREAGTTILVASHDDLVTDWADHVLTMQG